MICSNLKKIVVILAVFVSFSSASTLKSEVQKDSMLSSGFTGFLIYENNHYLISVGISQIKNPTIQAKVNAIKEAKLSAQKELTKFIYEVTVKTKEELISKMAIIKDGKNTTRITDEKYIEIIKENNDGILKNTIDIGKWKVKDEYFYALGTKIILDL